MKADRLMAIVPGSVAVVATLVLWETISRTGSVNPVLLPPPSIVVQTLYVILTSRSFVAPLAHTLALLFAGYAVACILGVSIGVMMGLNSWIEASLDPVVEFLRPIPKPALIPPLFLFLGMGLKTMLVIVALAAFFPILINTIQGIRGIDPILIATVRTFRVSKFRSIFIVILPGALPMIAGGMRVSLGLALTLVTLAEMLLADEGIGFLILDKQRAFQINQMYAWLLVLAALGWGLNFIFELVERRMIPWRGKS